MKVSLEVQILNLTYSVVGFDAIRDLKAWLDEHASDVRSTHAPPPLAGEVAGRNPEGPTE